MSTPEKSGPPAPGETEPGPFGDAKLAVVNIAGANSDNAWKRLMTALSRDFQGGMHRAHAATKRLERLK